MSQCPCSSGADYEKCCGQYLEKNAAVPTAEALMRSRYTAYVKKNLDWVEKTHLPGGEEFDRKAAEEWSNDSEWIGLRILNKKNGQETDSKGEVEFIASYKIKGRTCEHQEKALFEKVDGTWFYKDGKIVTGQPIVNEGPKIGRNDPCPCGSGKKHKKCCLNA